MPFTMGNGKLVDHMERGVSSLLIEELISKDNSRTDVLNVPTGCLYFQTELSIVDLLKIRWLMERES
jgi:hypothetical protein